MAVNEVMLGAGLATGMFYHAPEGTDLPASPEASLAGWTKVGDVTEEGITWGVSRDFTPLKDWAGKIKRQLPGTDPRRSFLHAPDRPPSLSFLQTAA